MKRVLLCALAALTAASGNLPAQSLPGGTVGNQATFGRAVGIASGDVLVGEPNNATKSGLVYVYRKAAGKWAEVTALSARDAKPSDGFGNTLDISGNLMIVGAARADDNKGAAYVFQRDTRGAWTEIGKLSANDGVANEGFTSALAISGDLAVVAAPTQNKQTGAVYVYRRTDTSWAQEAKLLAPEAKEQGFFGQAVAIVGDRILVGEPGRDERTGAAHVFARQGDNWTAVARLSASNLQKNDRFGAPIAVDGNRVFVGALTQNNQMGSVFVFQRDAQGEMRETSRLFAYEARPGEQFGTAIAATGSNIFVGVPRTRGARGAVYHIWRNDADTLGGSVNRITMPGAQSPDFFGSAVAASGNLAVFAASNDDNGLGTVFMYEFANGKWTLSAPVMRPDERIASVVGKKVECATGKAANFDCSNVDLMSYLSVPEMGGGRGVQLNDIWGWTDPETGKEWALVGRTDGTSFVDISNPEKPRYAGDMPMTKGANAAAWRDIKVYKNHAYVVADGSGAHGIQVFDLTRLRKVTTPQTFEPDLTYRNVNSVHNIVINEETGYAYAVGASSGGETCGGGLHMVDIREPKKPTFAGCFADPQTGRASTGYSHDAQCVIYKGPDEQYRGKEICLGSNETMLSIADVSDKKAPKAISRASYPNVGYSHQGWFDEEQRYFYMDDELDELAGSVPQTRTIVWDLNDLDDPQVAAEYLSPTSASDHNLYIKGDTMYQSHYRAGLRVVDISNRTKPVEVGFFDTVPYGGNTPGFGGSWSNYPYFKSGNLVVTSGNEGLFVVRKRNTNKPVL
jgi:choice-of-anchor B domain-containing protein